MKHKFKEFLENLDYNEVLDLKKQIKEPSSAIKDVLANHIDVIERMNSRICATCGNQLNINTKNLTLHFGPEDFKKKASFCAFDCLEFFLQQLKSIEMKKEKAIR
ncbi:TPA: hypothetical protein HA219_00970 [Candidatus Woesearchaeota archaeon]|nr:hypothetical protein [Candidatus Woesearchaeota archaeon]HIH39282.1 hypothetical protein [Candidatus Woesearchaeota archaeon]